MKTLETDKTKFCRREHSLEEFISMSSHQLRNSLTIMHWYSEALLSGVAGELNDQQKRYLQTVYMAGQRLVKLVNDFLDVSRIESANLIVEPVPTDLQKIAADVLLELWSEIKEKRLTIRQYYEDSLPLVNIDPKIAQIILQNLLSNAVKYTPKKGKVKILMKKQKDLFLIEVADNGFGVPKSQQAKIFNKFFRADNIKTKVLGGTGLGLYLVKLILQKIGGQVWFVSEQGLGSIFYVLIPIDR